MSLSIKEKVEKLKDYHLYSNDNKLSSFLKFSGIIAFFTIYFIPFLLYVGVGDKGRMLFDNIPTNFLETVYIYSCLPSIIVLGFLILDSIILFSREKTNIFSKHLKMLKFKKELDSEFGSVESISSTLKELDDLHMEQNDSNVYRILSGSIFSKKRNKLKIQKNSRINKIDLRIKSLLEEKELIYSKISSKEKELLERIPADNKIKEVFEQIENKSSDISISASEMKARVLSNI